MPTADVVILYTRAAREQAGGDQAIRLQLEQAVFDANVAYANSLAAFEIRAAVMLETDYPESGNFSTDLTRLRSPSDGYADEAIALRDTVFNPNGGTRIATLPQGASSYFDDQATEGVVYTYWARAVERQGLGGFSAPDTGVAAPAGEPIPGDLSGDGVVDGNDLGVLLGLWTG